jgi:hypothetical protein
MISGSGRATARPPGARGGDSWSSQPPCICMLPDTILAHYPQGTLRNTYMLVYATPCTLPEVSPDYPVPFSRCVLYRSGNSRHTPAKPGKPRLRHCELPIHHILSSSHQPISLQAPRHDASAVPCCPYEGPSDSALPKEGTCEGFDVN